MKKSFYFALALTAGLFASCSSDEIAQAPNGGLAVDDNTPVKIEIGTASVGTEVTRGTGRVGDATAAANAQFDGQKISVLMLEKGTMLGAYMDNNRNAGEELLKGQEMTVTGSLIQSLANDAVYYPTADAQGNPKVYDFWGYRLDGSEVLSGGEVQFKGYDVAAAAAAPAEFTTTTYDAEADFTTALGANVATVVADKDAAEADAALKAIGTYFYKNNTDADASTASTAWWSVNVTAAATGAAGNQITIPFEIDGTHDVMVATTTPSNNSWNENHENLIFSAKSARQGVKPNMVFKHLLSSLTFKVKPKSRDITNWADNPTTDPTFVPGYQVTNITLKSMATGELIVAYTGATEPAERIIWDAGQDWATPGSLTDFKLHMRKYQVDDKADIKMVKISTATTATGTLNYDNTTDQYVDMLERTSYVIPAGGAPDGLVVYDAEGTDQTTGLPLGNKKTIGELRTANQDYGWILTYNSTDRATAPEKKFECKYKATPEPLTEDLVPFEDNADVEKYILQWTDPTTAAVYAVTEITEAEYDALPAINKLGVKAADLTANKENLYKAYYIAGTPNTYKQITRTSADVWTDAANVAKAPRVIGAPMLVAPSNDAANSGYVATVTCKYYKKKNLNEVEWVTKTTDPFVINNYTVEGGNRVPCAFEAGKNYNVTITLYSDGEILNGEGTGKPWVNSDQELDANDND